MSIMNEEWENFLMPIKKILDKVSIDKGLCLDYAKICCGALTLLREIWPKGYDLPINVERIYNKLGIEVKKINLNEFMNGGDWEKVNRIIGKISIRPDYLSGNKKVTVYIDEEASPATVNYTLAHELCHLILSYTEPRYTDDYCIMPMLPKKKDELIADAFAIFLVLPLDCFLDTFEEYIKMSMENGLTPIDTADWLNYLGSATAVPYYYVASGYQQIRHVAFLMYEKRIVDKEASELYEMVKDKLTKEVRSLLFQ